MRNDQGLLLHKSAPSSLICLHGFSEHQVAALGFGAWRFSDGQPFARRNNSWRGAAA
jgi:hypothetical protein